LALLFSVCFVVILPVTAAIRYLHVWIEAACHIPAETIEIFASLISAGQWALPVTLYVSVLLALSYSARKALSAPVSILCIFVLSIAFTGGIYLGLSHAGSSAKLTGQSVPPVLAGPGLILTQGDTTVVLLDDPSNPASSRVIAVPDRPLFYQKITGPVRTRFTLPRIPFKIENPYFMASLSIDFALAAGQLQDRLSAGLIPFALYVGALCLLLSSLRFIMELTSWPLANIFLGAMVFRGILAAGTFLDSEEIQQFIKISLKEYIPQVLITPSIFCAVTLLVIVYTVLVNVARGRRTLR
jgi:hypothetical protein